MEFVILDIETTGLDLQYSHLLEVGAVLVRDFEEVEHFHSFVQHTQPLPLEIKRLTGITEEIVKEAPSEKEVLTRLKSFVAERPVVAHFGYKFDFPFLENRGLAFKNGHDSVEFAFYLLPTNSTGHSIQALAQRFGLGKEKHRALEDCRMELAVIQALRAEYEKKSASRREALKANAEMHRWWWSACLPGEARPHAIVDLITPYKSSLVTREQDSIAPQTLQSISINEVDQHFLAKGATADYSENRPGQRHMALLVATSLNSGTHAVIEGGTGIGKSKAYLVPTVLFGLRNKIPMVVSTFTKALQDQLFLKEIPHLRATVSPEFRVAVLKGKKNYICLEKFNVFLDKAQPELFSHSPYKFTATGVQYNTPLAALLLTSWIIETQRGDWDEIPYWLRERIPKGIEADICNLDELCGPVSCASYDSLKCFLAQARARARDANLVIMNHAILLAGIIPRHEEESDPEAGGVLQLAHTVLPDVARYVVFDEAHHLEEAATSAWEAIVSENGLRVLIKQLYSAGARRQLEMAVKLTKSNRVLNALEAFNRTEEKFNQIADTLFQKNLPVLVPPSEYQGAPSHVVLSGSTVQTSEWNVCRQLLIDLHDSLRIVYGELQKVADEVENEVLEKRIRIYARTVEKTLTALSIITLDDKVYVRYLEKSDNDLAIKASPISVGPILKEFVYDNFRSVILTSATLTVEGQFKFFKERSGTRLIPQEGLKVRSFPSSFNYGRQSKFFVPKGIVYTKETSDQHLQQCSEFLVKAIRASRGGSLILCSSYQQVQVLYEALLQPLQRENILLLRQDRKKSVNSLLVDFREEINSVLIGTRTLWEGVDVPGPALRSLYHS